MSPFVSIIIPVHIEEKFIAHCLEPIMNQDRAPRSFEVVVWLVRRQSRQWVGLLVRTYKILEKVERAGDSYNSFFIAAPGRGIFRLQLIPNG